MADQNTMALSPQQPFNGRRVRRIPGLGQTNQMNDHLNRTRNYKKNHFNIATVNVATMRDKEEEVIEVMKERNVAIMGLCETRYRGKGDTN